MPRTKIDGQTKTVLWLYANTTFKDLYTDLTFSPTESNEKKRTGVPSRRSNKEG